MPSLKEVRIRIASVKSTQQITSAMKMVAASKLRRAQNAILNLRPYATKLREMMGSLSADATDTGFAALTEQRKPENILLVVVSSNRGLCGAFNTNVIKATLDLMNVKYAGQHQNGNVQLLLIGKKAGDFFSKRKYPVAGTHHELFDGLSSEKAIPVAERVMQDFTSKKYDRVEVIYNQFKNAAVQRLVVEPFLPLVPESTVANASGSADYIYEPTQEEILSDLIPRSLKIQFYKTLLDSFASEHGARMTAMHKATDNATELLKELKLTYNKVRQATITNEILEIVSGAEALKG